MYRRAARDVDAVLKDTRAGELAMEPPQKVRADGKSQNCAGNRLDGPAHAGGAGRPTDRV